MSDADLALTSAPRAAGLPAPYDGMLRAYAAALAGSRLADSSRAVYLRRVRGYLAWIAVAAADGRRARRRRGLPHPAPARRHGHPARPVTKAGPDGQTCAPEQARPDVQTCAPSRMCATTSAAE
ncbi:hypothetical protein FAF44_44410 [Nonomuraea sp. MG754425]|uniref:hypothetical protein n=1 Tax=Nonomuraea sp. MG754425 TaxID=2570319 RepID=UPI001F294C8C|nr:hypothetical protein [Nonomuraea sp. MG754425]MCF6475355.1 hypothetical protein [Nonomuraea sp. MG754425]